MSSTDHYPFSCDVDGCDEKFPTRSERLKHKSRSHLTVGSNSDKLKKSSKPFVCQVPGCDQKFALQRERLIHMKRFHSKETGERSRNQKLREVSPKTITEEYYGGGVGHHAFDVEVVESQVSDHQEIFEEQVIEYQPITEEQRNTMIDNDEADLILQIGDEEFIEEGSVTKRSPEKRKGSGCFACPMSGCKEKFYSRAEKIEHLNWHSGISTRNQTRTSYLGGARRKSAKKSAPETLFRCPIENCESVFVSKNGCSKHMLKIHPEEWKEMKKPSRWDSEKPRSAHVFDCHVPSCTCTFVSRGGRSKHMRTVHPDFQVPLKKGKKCGICQELFKDFESLCEHAKSAHDIPADIFSLTFDTEIKFRMWKAQQEQEANVEYPCRSSKNLGELSLHICHRSGSYQSQASPDPFTSRAPRDVQSLKLGFDCTAFISSRRDPRTDRIYVKACLTHYGHDVSAKYLHVAPETQCKVLDLLKDGRGPKWIVGYLEQNGTDREKLMKDMDIRNIMLRYGIQLSEVADTEYSVTDLGGYDDETSVTSFEQGDITTEDQSPMIKSSVKENFRLGRMHDKHRAAMKMGSVQVTTTDFELDDNGQVFDCMWSVQAAIDSAYYHTVSKADWDCRCSVVCRYCGVCPENYSCDCDEYQRQYKYCACKHIHLVHSMTTTAVNSAPVEDQPYIYTGSQKQNVIKDVANRLQSLGSNILEVGFELEPSVMEAIRKKTGEIEKIIQTEGYKNKSVNRTPVLPTKSKGTIRIKTEKPKSTGKRKKIQFSPEEAEIAVSSINEEIMEQEYIDV